MDNKNLGTDAKFEPLTKQDMLDIWSTKRSGKWKELVEDFLKSQKPAAEVSGIDKTNRISFNLKDLPIRTIARNKKVYLINTDLMPELKKKLAEVIQSVEPTFPEKKEKK